MMGMEVESGKCAMATTEGVPGLYLCLCPHLANPWHYLAPPSPTWDSSYSRTGSSPCNTSTGCTWQQCTTGASTPLHPPRWYRT